MAILRCKICGGTLDIREGESVAVCEYCGTRQTLPKLDDERKANMYDRANHFRRLNEFDKAMGIYEQILAEDNTDAETYWSLVLCRYGIEYVEDPATRKYLPTVNRMQYTSVLADEDYKSALHYADGYQKEIYEEEARAIDQIQKGIMAISSKEEPFDIFICYKETDNSGSRTPDSVLAFDMYSQLTREGFRVFFSRVTLEDKLGQEYEPYIFAALNSARVMIVVGTKPEYFNAPWVRNEWGRYLAMIGTGAKKTLIPAYRDMDPYDLPDEFSHLQAQDMSKLGFMQDLIRGIHKIIDADKPKETVSTKAPEAAPGGLNGSLEALLKRAGMALEDGEWEKADEFYESALNQDAECGMAYLGKLLVRERCTSVDAFIRQLSERFLTAEEEVFIACEEDTERLQKVYDKINGKVNNSIVKDIMQKAHTYERTFSSKQNSLKRKKEAYDSYLANDKLLQRAKRYASGKVKDRLDEGLSEIREELDKQIAEAGENDAVTIDGIRAEYAQYLDGMESTALQLQKEREEVEKKRRQEEERNRIETKKKAIRFFELIWKTMSVLVGICAVYDLLTGAKMAFIVLLVIPYTYLLHRIHRNKGTSAGIIEYLAALPVIAVFALVADNYDLIALLAGNYDFDGSRIKLLMGAAILIPGLVAACFRGRTGKNTNFVMKWGTRIVKGGIVLAALAGIIFGIVDAYDGAEFEYRYVKRDMKELSDYGSAYGFSRAIEKIRPLGAYKACPLWMIQCKIGRWSVAKEAYKNGKDAGKEDNWKDAYGYFEDALYWDSDGSNYEYVYKDADKRMKKAAYKAAEQDIADGILIDQSWGGAITWFERAGDYKDAQERWSQTADLLYQQAKEELASKECEVDVKTTIAFNAMRYFNEISDYNDAQSRGLQFNELLYQLGMEQLMEREYSEAQNTFFFIPDDYKDSVERNNEAAALDDLSDGEYKEAQQRFGYLDVLKEEACYLWAEDCYEAENMEEARIYFELAGDYSDARERLAGLQEN